MEKVPKQKSVNIRPHYVEIQPIPFQNDDPINDQLEDTGKSLVVLQPIFSFHYVV